MAGLLFYDPNAGHGEFYSSRSTGSICRTRLHTGWRRTWRSIIPGNFGGDGFTDLLFYDPATATGEFYATDRTSKISLLKQHTNWRSSWTHIIPGNFGGNGFTDLLFYDPSSNTGEFYATDGQGGITLLRQHTNWRSSWTQIIPGNFGGNGFTDLLFYDPSSNTGELYTTDGQGGLSLLRTHTNWRSSWTQIIPGNFGGNGFTDLLFYDPSSNTGEFYTTDGSGGISLLKQHTNWRSSWNRIVTGDLGGNAFTDLLFYDAAANTGELYTTNGSGDISLLRQHTNWRSTWSQIVAGGFSTRSRVATVHFKSLRPLTSAINSFIDDQFSAMAELFSRSGLTAARGTTEDLSGNPALAHLLDLDVGTCTLGRPTQEHIDLFANRNGAGANDMVIYIVSTLIGGSGNLLGCATHPAGQPGAAVVQSSARWLVAHELGHVLGLRHVCEFSSPTNPCVAGSNQSDSLMFPNVGWTNVPPDLSSAEEITITESSLTRPC
jgi:hypothetical protein